MDNKSVKKENIKTKVQSKENTTNKKEQKLTKGEKYLPIGTVVLLKGGVKRVMITGFCVSRKENPGEMWDYSGCMYPEGIFSSDNTLMFDHAQITEVFHIGLIDEEEKDFKKRLQEEVEKIENKK